MVYGIVQLEFSDWNSVKFWFIREVGWHQDQTMGERESKLSDPIIANPFSAVWWINIKVARKDGFSFNDERNHKGLILSVSALSPLLQGKLWLFNWNKISLFKQICPSGIIPAIEQVFAMSCCRKGPTPCSVSWSCFF